MMNVRDTNNSPDSNSTPIESMYQTSSAPEPVALDSADGYDDLENETYEEEQKRIAETVVAALQMLSRAGVMKWRVGDGWARGCLGVRLDHFYDGKINRFLWITNEHELDDHGDRDEQSFDVDAEPYWTLMGAVLSAMSDGDET